MTVAWSDADGPRLDHDWWPGRLPNNVTFGTGSWLWSSYLFLHHHSQQPLGVRIGAHTGVYAGTTFELGPSGSVTIGDYATIVAPTFATNGPISIGDHAFIANQVYIADRALALPPHELAEDPEPSPPITMGDAVWIGARAIVLGGVHLGEGAIVAAGAVVTDSVADHAIAAGNPARVVANAPPGLGRDAR